MKKRDTRRGFYRSGKVQNERRQNCGYKQYVRPKRRPKRLDMWDIEPYNSTNLSHTWKHKRKTQYRTDNEPTRRIEIDRHDENYGYISSMIWRELCELGVFVKNYYVDDNEQKFNLKTYNKNWTKEVYEWRGPDIKWRKGFPRSYPIRD